MRILAIPNWSFGRDTDLLNRFREVLDSGDLAVHYLQGDVDHNRTVSAFSGPDEAVYRALEKLCELAFDRIDLNHHIGVHPRIGALDVCPFLALPDHTLSRTASPPNPPAPSQAYPYAAQPVAIDRLLAEVETFAAKIAGRFGVPVFLYEKSERGRHEADLPSLRKGGFGGLLGQELHPDFGPSYAHPQLGVSVIGVRDFLTTINVNLTVEDPALAKALAHEIRTLRASGDGRFLGVRAMGFPLSSVGLSQVSLSLTLPGLTPVDPIIEWLISETATQHIKVRNSELVGVIRRRDLEGATRLIVKEAQVVEI